MAKRIPLPEVKSVIEEMKERHPNTADQLIPLLQFVQGKFGFLPREGMKAIAEYLKVPESHVYGVATFYAQFRFKPLGKNRLTVCRGTACHVRGSARLIEEIQRDLLIKDGETTEDMMFSLETVACIGSCALAPVVVVNDKVHGKSTTKRIKQVIDKLREGPTDTELPEKPRPKRPKKKAAGKKAKPSKRPAAKAKPKTTKPKKTKTAAGKTARASKTKTGKQKAKTR